MTTTHSFFLAHDHMDRLEDFQRDLPGGAVGKILHLTVDGWIEAPTREDYERTYYSLDGFLERGLAAAAKVLNIAAAPDSPIAVVRTGTDLAEARRAGKLAVVLGNEGGKILGTATSTLDAWWHLGLRHVQLNWAMRNQLAASQSNESEPEQPGLTPLGEAMVERANELGVLIDVSHSAPQTIRDVLRVTRKPILNSHSGSRELAPKQQNLWDDQIQDMADNGGVVAAHFCSRLVLGVDDRQSEIPDVVRQIRYLVDKGGIDLVALGPDYILGKPERDVPYLRNTNQQTISWTKGLEDSSELPNLLPALEEAGFTEPEIDKITSGNMLRLLKDVLPGAATNRDGSATYADRNNE